MISEIKNCNPLIRRAVSKDALAIAAVHVSSWSYAYNGLIPESSIRSHTNSSRAAFWLDFIKDSNNWPVFVLDTDDGVKGFASAIPARDNELDQMTVSELAAIYLDESVSGKGFGAELIRYCWAEARSREYTTMVLWVLERNERAVRFYQKHGFEKDSAFKYEARLMANEIRLQVEMPKTERGRGIIEK